MDNYGATKPDNIYEESSGTSIEPPPPAYSPPPYNPYDDQHQKQQSGPGSVQYSAGGPGADAAHFVVVTQDVHKTGEIPITQSFTAHYVMSCLAFWLCGFLFGGIAFILAIFAKKKAQNDEGKKARSYSSASLALSVVGFITGCVLWGFLIWYIVDCCLTDCPYQCKGLCYEERSDGDDCTDDDNYCYDNGYCYYN